MNGLPGLTSKFQTILADPPWRFQNRTGKVAPEHVRLRRYETMSVEEICALPVAAHAANHFYLYL
jgi:N6-adenosine-specific RNA methylase IME4